MRARMLTVMTTIVLLLTSTAYANLIIVKQTGNTVSAMPYLKDIQLPTQDKILADIKPQLVKLKGHKISVNKLLYPAKSNFTVGTVLKHKLVSKHFDSLPIFVIGPDGYSIKWAKENWRFLRNIHAFGIITNVKDAEIEKCVEKKTNLFLTPANINGLSQLIGTKHYPVLIYKNWVLQ